MEFNGSKLSDICACIVELPHYTAAVRDLTFITISGRSGDIITDNNRYGNVALSYKISCIPNARQTAQEFVYRLTQWLYGTHEYAVLRDTYNCGYYRKAVCTGIDDMVNTGGVVTATVTFNCKPWLYSDVGAIPTAYTLESSGTSIYTTKATVHNPEQWARPPGIA
ncbi:MAG: hypothetical protein LUD19_01975 [Clostridia bacterium]|nr:hypothetical protein [Clostridia bacterium]